MEADFQEILLTWAGVDAIDPNSRSSNGADIDARHIAFLEKFFDTPFIQHGQCTDPMHMAADKLEEAYTIISDNYRAQLLVQLGVGDLFGGTLSYDPWEGVISGDTDLSQTAIADLGNLADTLSIDLTAFWSAVVRFLTTIKPADNYTMQEVGWIDAAIDASGSALTFGDLVDTDDTLNPINGTAGNDTLNGTAGHDEIICLTTATIPSRAAQGTTPFMAGTVMISWMAAQATTR